MVFDKVSYYDKRRFLWNKYNEDMDVFVETSFVANEILNLLDKPLFRKINMFDCIIKYLVEGYFVCTKKDFEVLDPCNLVLNVRYDKVVWDRWIWKDIDKTFDFNEIYYFSYDSSKYISLVDRMLDGGFDIYDDALLGEIIHKAVDVFTNYEFDISKVVKKEDNTISRIFKLNKINDNLSNGK